MAQSSWSSVTSQNVGGLEESWHKLTIPRPVHNPRRTNCNHDVLITPEGRRLPLPPQTGFCSRQKGLSLYQFPTEGIARLHLPITGSTA